MSLIKSSTQFSLLSEISIAAEAIDIEKILLKVRRLCMKNIQEKTSSIAYQ